MAILTEAPQVALIYEGVVVSLVWYDVVNLSCRHHLTHLQAYLAVGVFLQCERNQVFTPHLEVIKVMMLRVVVVEGLAYLLVRLTIAVKGNLRTGTLWPASRLILEWHVVIYGFSDTSGRDLREIALETWGHLAGKSYIVRITAKHSAMRHIDEIILHCTATPEGRWHDVEDIRAWHVDGNGWSDVGYHFVVLLDGTIEEGRPVSRQGAHCRGKNKTTIGIAYVGGMDEDMQYPKDTLTDEQEMALEQLICELRDEYGDDLKLSGHNDYSNKACPSFDVREKFSYLV